MNKKRKGYLILENIISISLITIMASLVVSVFSTSVFNLRKTYKTEKIINLANKEMAFIEYEIQNSEEETFLKTTEKNISEFNIKSYITKKDDLFNCYKVVVCVKSNENQILIKNYVVKI